MDLWRRKKSSVLSTKNAVRSQRFTLSLGHQIQLVAVMSGCGSGLSHGLGVLVKAVRGKVRRVGHIASAAHVPFAEVPGGVTGGLEARALERRGRRIEEIRLLATPIAGPSLQ